MPDPYTGISGVSEYSSRADHQHSTAPIVAWTPIITQGVTPGQTVTDGKTIKKKREVTGKAQITFSGVGTVAALLGTFLPYAASSAAAGLVVGTFFKLSGGGVPESGVLLCAGTGLAVLFHVPGNANYFGFAPAYTIAIGDNLYLNIAYFAAS